MKEIKIQPKTDWSIPDDNGKIYIPDELYPLFNKIGFQFRFHTLSGKNEFIAIAHCVQIAEQFFKEKYLLEFLKLNDWMERATAFDLGDCKYHNRPVKIELRLQIDNSKAWVVKMHEWVLGKDVNWHYEPLPSNRTDEFISNTRFKTVDEAFVFWKDNVKSEFPLYLH